MGEICTDNRFEIIEVYKKKLMACTNIETSPDEMEVIDNVLFRFWQMGWLPQIPHGRLIDADALEALFWDGQCYFTANIKYKIENIPTIIPAEEDET